MRLPRNVQTPPFKPKRLAALALVLAAFACASRAAFAQDAPPPVKVATVEGVTEYRLANGLRVVLYPDASAPKFTVNMTVLAGSRHEGYGQTGMAHLLEHMLFKGTPTHRDIKKELFERGAAADAETSVDRTSYFETLTATDANLEFALRLEADRLVNSLLRREDLIAEMTVVRNEFEKFENNPLAILGQRMRATAYDWHNYGKETIGNRTDIERVPIERLRAFYRKFYRPDNVVLAVTGKFDEAKALGLTTKYFGPLKRPSDPIDPTYTEEPARDGERSVVLRRVGSVGAAAVLYHVPAARHEDFSAVRVMVNVLGAEPHGRLYDALVKSKKVEGVGGAAEAHFEPGNVLFVATLDAARSPEQARDAVIDVVERFASTPVSEAEVERVKRGYAVQYEAVLADSQRMAEQLVQAAALGDWRLFFLHRDRIARVTPADVTRVAARYLRRNNRTVALYVPTREAERVEIPAARPAAELVKDYRGSAGTAAGESFDPTPENLERRTRRLVLPSGVKAALLPKKTRGRTVTARLTLRYGNERSLKDNLQASRLLGALMLRGTKERGRQQVIEDLDKLGASITATGGDGTLTFTVTGKRDTFPQALRILGEVLRSPALDAGELELLKQEQKQNQEEKRTDPVALGFRALARKLSPYPAADFRYVPTPEEQVARIEAVTVEQVRRLYAGQVGGQVGEFAVVGDFDPDATAKLMAELLEGWKSSVPYERLPGADRTDVAAARVEVRTPDKANALFTAGHLIAMTPDHPDYLALWMGNHVLGGSANSRLFARVRDKEGLSYTVRSEVDASDGDAAGVVSVLAICNPQNIGKVERVIAEELKRFVSEGVGEAELSAARTAVAQEFLLAWSDDANVAATMMNHLHWGRTFAYTAERDRKRASLTAAEVNAAIRKHLDPSRLVIVRAGDFKTE